jgi:hypothetical protein
LVVGVRFGATGFFAAGVPAPLALPLGALFFLVTVDFFCDAAGCFPVVPATPEDTRDECLVRWRTTFFAGAAASAIELTVNAATSATSNVFMVLRIMAVP